MSKNKTFGGDTGVDADYERALADMEAQDMMTDYNLGIVYEKMDNLYDAVYYFNKAIIKKSK